MKRYRSDVKAQVHYFRSESEDSVSDVLKMAADFVKEERLDRSISVNGILGSDEKGVYFMFWSDQESGIPFVQRYDAS